MKILRKALEIAPSLRERVASAARLILIVAKGAEVADVFDRKADMVLHYDDVLLDSFGREFTRQSAADFAPEDILVIRHLKARAITEKLRQCGFGRAIIDLTHLVWRETSLLDTVLIRDNLARIERVFERLDTQSAEIFLCLLLFRIKADPDILKFSDYPQYLHKNILSRLNEREIIIDGGAFTGDSAFLFLAATQGRVDIFGFEPDAANYDIMFRNILHHRVNDRIHALPYGLYDSRTTLRFNSASQSSRIVENGVHFIRTVDIDGFCQFFQVQPTLIKLDVEGAELHALRGAGGTIRQNKPKLLISLYHRAEDLWEIPEFIISLRDDYIFHIGHHSSDLTIYETTLYAY
jgi:FkbM family methyltransferase